MPICLTPTCKWRPPGECVYYSGDNISGVNITNGDNLNKVINLLSDYVKSQATLTKHDLDLGAVPNIDTSNASNISSGTLGDARLSSNVALKNINNAFTTSQGITGDLTVSGNIVGDNTQNVTVLGADVISISTALDDVTDLEFSVENGSTYAFKFYITFTSAATTTGSLWSISGPGSSILSFSTRVTISDTAEVIANGLNANDEGTVTATSMLANNTAVIEGIFKAGTDGVVKARFASEVDASAITALQDLSFVEYRKIA